MALSISIGSSPVRRKERQKELAEIRARYKPAEWAMMAELIDTLGEQAARCFEARHYEDILGQLYEELELSNEWNGQFFTPQIIADMMGQMVLGEANKINQSIADKGYSTVGEPAVGSGVMMLGLANAFLHIKCVPQVQMVATCVDVDIRCIHMAYVQLSLYGIPAVLIHGNSLTVEEWSRWYTPVFIEDSWIWRERYGITTARNLDDEMLKMAMEPMYAVWVNIDLLTRELQQPFPAAPISYDVTLKEDNNGQTALF